MAEESRCTLTVGAELARLRMHTCVGDMIRAQSEAYLAWLDGGTPPNEAKEKLWSETRKAAERTLNRPVTRLAVAEMVMLAQEWATERATDPDSPFTLCERCVGRSGA